MNLCLSIHLINIFVVLKHKFLFLLKCKQNIWRAYPVALDKSGIWIYIFFYSRKDML